MKHAITLCSALFLCTAAPVAQADLLPGLVSDFESGTTEGWGGGASPTNIATGGPLGADDNYLQIGLVGGSVNLATHNTSVAGAIDPTIGSIQVDLFRPTGLTDLEVRLVLYGPGTGTRWASSVAAQVQSDGAWSTHTFSLLESDLTLVQGSGSYSDLLANLDRIMFRHDPGAPDLQNPSAEGTLGIDNVIALAIPEPMSGVLMLCGLTGIVSRRPRILG